MLLSRPPSLRRSLLHLSKSLLRRPTFTRLLVSCKIDPAILDYTDEAVGFKFLLIFLLLLDLRLIQHQFWTLLQTINLQYPLSVSKVMIKLKNGKRLKVHQYPDNIEKPINRKSEEEEFIKAARKDSKGFLPEAERLEKEYDVLLAPHLVPTFGDNHGKLRVSMQNKVNNHVVEDGRVEFVNAD
jgi:hypothetical protein